MIYSHISIKPDFFNFFLIIPAPPPPLYNYTYMHHDVTVIILFNRGASSAKMFFFFGQTQNFVSPRFCKSFICMYITHIFLFSLAHFSPLSLPFAPPSGIYHRNYFFLKTFLANSKILSLSLYLSNNETHKASKAGWHFV